MAFDRRKYPAMLHRRKHEIEGPPLPPEMLHERMVARARRASGKSTMLMAVMLGAMATQPWNVQRDNFSNMLPDDLS
jgi:hypothetical protein